MLLKVLFAIFIAILNIFNVNAQIQPLSCSVCVTAMKNEMGMNNENPVTFIVNSPVACTKATVDNGQQVSCINTFIQNAKNLFKNSINPNVNLMSVCMGVGCVQTPTVPPTKVPTKPPRFLF